MTNKSTLEYREKQKIETELQKVAGAERSYKISDAANRLAIDAIIITFLAIVVALVFDYMCIETNTMLIFGFITVSSLLAFLFVCIANSYKYKALSLLENYYKKKEI